MRKYYGSLVVSLSLIRFHLNVDSKLFYVFFSDAIVCVVAVVGLFVINFEVPRQLFIEFISITFLISLASLGFFFSPDPVGFFAGISRFIYLYLIYCLFSLLFANNCITSNLIYKSVKTLVIFNFIVVLVQLFEPRLITDIVHFLFATNKLKGLSFGSPHIYGTFMNVNWAGVIYSIITVVVLQGYKSRYYSFSESALITVILILSLLLTSSLTGIILFVISLTAWFFFHSLTMFLCVSGLVLLLVYSFFDLLPFSERLVSLIGIVLFNQDLSNIPSLAVRLQYFQEAFSLISTHPVFGVGDTTVNPHNSFISMWLYFGFSSVFVLISYFIILIKSFSGITSHLSIISTLVIIIASMTGQYVFSTQVMSFYVLIISFSKYN